MLNEPLAQRLYVGHWSAVVTWTRTVSCIRSVVFKRIFARPPHFCLRYNVLPMYYDYGGVLLCVPSYITTLCCVLVVSFSTRMIVCRRPALSSNMDNAKPVLIVNDIARITLLFVCIIVSLSYGTVELN